MFELLIVTAFLFSLFCLMRLKQLDYYYTKYRKIRGEEYQWLDGLTRRKTTSSWSSLRKTQLIEDYFENTVDRSELLFSRLRIFNNFWLIPLSKSQKEYIFTPYYEIALHRLKEKFGSNYEIP